MHFHVILSAPFSFGVQKTNLSGRLQVSRTGEGAQQQPNSQPASFSLNSAPSHCRIQPLLWSISTPMSQSVCTPTSAGEHSQFHAWLGPLRCPSVALWTAHDRGLSHWEGGAVLWGAPSIPALKWRQEDQEAKGHPGLESVAGRPAQATQTMSQNTNIQS